MNVIFENFIVEILTPTPRRLTAYRGTASNGQPGLVVGGNYYQTAHVEVSGLTEEDTTSPTTITVTLGNAKNTATDLVTDGSNRRAKITISKVEFDANWNITGTKTWFIGKTGAPAFQGEVVTLQCHAHRGRKGPSPSKDSSTLMTSHTPPAAGTKQPWFTG